MKFIREYTQIPAGCVEYLFPSKLLESTILKRIGIINGGISSLTSGFIARRISHRAFHIIIITLSGEGEFIMEDGTTTIVKERDMFFSHADGQGHIHRPHKEPWNILWFQVHVDATWCVPPSLDWKISVSTHANKIEYCMKQLMEEELNHEYESFQAQSLLSELLMIYLQRELHATSGHYHEKYHKQFNRLWTHVASSLDKPWSLDDLAKSIYVSRAHLYRLCKLFYQCTPAEKVKSIKMEHAMTLLKNFDCAVSQVAEYIGYQNTSTFSNAFKHYFGFPPSKAAGKKDILR